MKSTKIETIIEIAYEAGHKSEKSVHPSKAFAALRHYRQAWGVKSAKIV